MIDIPKLNPEDYDRLKDRIYFICKDFNELNIFELYEIVKARYEVFACEQEITCENDFDDKDKICKHLFVIDEEYGLNRVIGYCRLLPPGISYEDASIGRVLVISDYRNKGIARKMMVKAINKAQDNGMKVIGIHSNNEIALKLYKSLGFVTKEFGEREYLEMKL